MSPSPPANDLNTVLIVGVGILVFAWYAYQIASRKQQWIRYKAKRMLVFLIVYAAGVYVLAQQRLPSLEVGVFSALAGLGSGWLLVAPPKSARRIPRTVRRQVIARDLTSKGLDWDPAKYHIDHIVPFSRGGDNSLRNLRVVQKEKNLRKGDKMPSFWDFLKG
ncbi:MAG TPA: HNH endonuclease domain-containing protein [Terriglobia bacterium]|nr:HNH endonuclease domain-containing protein [Terriglobia bacterium]